MKRTKKMEQLAMFAAPVAEPVKAAPVVRDLAPEAERLLANFEVLAEAPGGVKRLREVVLELAVRGALVHPYQAPVPSNAEFRQAASLLASTLGLRVTKEEVSEHEVPFEIPSHWRWMMLGDLGVAQTGTTPNKNDANSFNGEIPFIKPADILPRSINYSNESLTRDGAERGSRLAPAGSLLMVCIGTIGKCNVLERECAFNQQINSLSPIPFIESRFLLIAARAPYFHNTAWQKSSSTTIAILNKSKWLSIPVPVPPLAEQKRIVAKVDELMKLCDELEARQTKERETGARLTKAALDALANAEGPKEVAASWERVVGNFEGLISRAEDVKTVRETVLSLAVRGRLVTQEATDEHATLLMVRAQEERKNLIRAGKAKETKLIEETQQVDAPTLPPNWAWAMLNDISIKITDGEHATPKRESRGCYLLSARNIRDGFIDVSDVDYVGIEEFEKIRKRCDPDAGDILLSCSGSIGRVAVVDANDKYSMVRSAALIKHSKANIDSQYLALALRSPHLQQQMGRSAKQSAQPNLFIDPIRRLVIPLPPLAEQKRIVAKVDQLMALCDELETALRQTEETSRKVAEALVAELVQPKPAA